MFRPRNNPQRASFKWLLLIVIIFVVVILFNSLSLQQSLLKSLTTVNNHNNKSARSSSSSSSSNNNMPFIPREIDELASHCPLEILDYVVNATDATDECEGLQRAFASSCSSLFDLNKENTPHYSSTPKYVNYNHQAGDRYNRRLLDVIHDTESDITDVTPLLQVGSSLAAASETGSITFEQPITSSIAEETADDIFPPVDELTEDRDGDNNNNNHNVAEVKGQTLSSEKTPTQTTATITENQVTPECCQSILRHYNEACNETDTEELSDRKLFFVVSIIAICGLVKTLIRNFKIWWLSEAGGCILVGVVGGALLHWIPHFDVSFDNTFFLRVMLPPIVFEASISINKRAFQRHFLPIMAFATCGTIFSAAVTAGAVHYGSYSLGNLCETIPKLESFAFGALISSIDPVAILSILSSLGIGHSDTVFVLIFGESLLNDGIAIVLYDTIIGYLDEQMVIDSAAIWRGVIQFTIVTFGSVFVGIVCGALCNVYFKLMHGCQTPLIEVVSFFCWALIPFYVCDDMEWSGIVGIVAAGFVMDIFVLGMRGGVSSPAALLSETNNNSNHSIGNNELDESHCSDVPPDDYDNQDSHNNHHRRRKEQQRPYFTTQGHLSPVAKRHIGFVLEVISTLMETAIFAYLGLFLYSTRYHWNFYLASTAIAACVLSRGMMIIIMSSLVHLFNKCRRKSSISSNSSSQAINGEHHHSSSTKAGADYVVIDKRTQLILWFSGLRGAMSFALVEYMPLFNKETRHGTRFKPELKAMTSASIFFTVFVFGGGTYYLMRYLGYVRLKDDEHIGESLPLVSMIREDHQGGRNGTCNGVDNTSVDSSDVTIDKSITSSQHNRSTLLRKVSPDREFHN